MSIVMMLWLGATASAGPVCDVLPKEKVAALFAAAGEPVKVGEATGFGDSVTGGFCTWELTDRTGAIVKLSLEAHQLEEVKEASCNGTSLGDRYREIAGLGDEACFEDGGSMLPQFEIGLLTFRSGQSVRKVQIIWQREGGVAAARARVAEAIGRAWFTGLELPVAGGW